MATIMPANDFLGSATGLLRLRRRPPPRLAARGQGGNGGKGGKKDRLGGEVRVHPLGAVGAAGAARAPAAPGRAEVWLVQVDPERADPGLPGDVQAALDVAGPHGGGQAEAGAGEPDRLRLVLVLDHG